MCDASVADCDDFATFLHQVCDKRTKSPFGADNVVRGGVSVARCRQLSLAQS